MRSKFLSIICLLILCCTFFNSCGPTLEFRHKKAQGFYPDTSDFPDTKWVCREVDMYFYMFIYGDSEMAGIYTVDGKEYRVTINFFYAEMSFEFYSHTDVSKSIYESGYLSCKRNKVDFLSTEYIYENCIITCKINNSDQNIWNYKGDTITFEKSGSIVEEVNSRYYCEELNMYIAKVIDGYYKGEIIIDDVVYYIHAIEIGNGEYYRFSIEDIRTTNQDEKIIHPFISMFFEHSENKIITTVSDEYILAPLQYPHWKTDKTTFVFVEELIPYNE